jgi:hypothetical protein
VILLLLASVACGRLAKRASGDAGAPARVEGDVDATPAKLPAVQETLDAGVLGNVFGDTLDRGSTDGGAPSRSASATPTPTYGHQGTRLPGAHSVPPPTLRQGQVTVNGRLPPEVVQRIVRQNFGRFRLCYENGLRSNPTLAGRVSVKFVIDASGAVSTSEDGGSDVPDQGVVQCVVRGFGNLSFPQPEAGIVTVVYPIIFSPGD